MEQSTRLVTVGRLGAPYGVKGWLKLQSFTKPLQNILSYQPWQVNLNGQWQGIKMEQARAHGKSLVVKLTVCQDRNVAAKFTNAYIAIPQDQLPSLPQNEFYWSDFVGLTVVNQQNITLGIVDHLQETGSNDVLIVKGSKEHWIPYLPGRYVLQVDLSQKTIVVDWDENF